MNNIKGIHLFNMIIPQYVSQVDEENSQSTGKDLFKQVNSTLYEIQTSKSKSNLKFTEENEGQKEPPKKPEEQKEDSPKQEQKKDILGAVKDKVAHGISKVKGTLRKDKKDSETKKQENKQDPKQDAKNENSKNEEKEYKPTYQEMMEQRKQANREMMERMKMSKVNTQIAGSKDKSLFSEIG